jgi:hypothetical protein
MKTDPMQPSVTLLSKLGSAVVHAEELLSPHGHELDRTAFLALANDSEVRAWTKAMGPLLPRKRNE